MGNELLGLPREVRMAMQQEQQQLQMQAAMKQFHVNAAFDIFKERVNQDQRSGVRPTDGRLQSHAEFALKSSTIFLEEAGFIVSKKPKEGENPVKPEENPGIDRKED